MLDKATVILGGGRKKLKSIANISLSLAVKVYFWSTSRGWFSVFRWIDDLVSTKYRFCYCDLPFVMIKSASYFCVVYASVPKKKSNHKILHFPFFSVACLVLSDLTSKANEITDITKLTNKYINKSRPLFC